MSAQLGRAAVVACALGGAACSHPHAPASAATTAAKITLAVLPAESDQFPHAAKAATSSMTSARVGGVDTTSVSKVSLEVVQLSIECVDATPTCYQAIGRSLAANRILFAQISAGAKPSEIKVSVTLFDVDAQATRHTAEKVFASEDAASAGTAELVAEATRP